MIKKKIPGLSAKDYALARASNKLYNFILNNGQVRGAMIQGTHMIREMRINHDLGILETLVLGHAFLGVSLMTANLKEKDTISLKIECSGPIRGLSVEANTYGEVRGYLKNNPIPIENPLESFDLSPFLGAGFLIVTHYPEFARQPYEGRIKLTYGSIARDLANYFLTSEQTPTAFNLSIKFDPRGKVTGAGGLFLQTMPGTDDRSVEELEQLLLNLPSIGETFSSHRDVEDFIKLHFHPFAPKILANRRVEFFCRCSRKTIGQFIVRLPLETLEDIVKNGPFPVETRCHNCGSVYAFDKEEIEAVYEKRAE